jgi:glycosyltransferase involved in cell wall biosynthesis
MTSNENKLGNLTIIIPLHLPLDYPCDYIDQTAKILAKKNTVILFDYFFPYSWKNLLDFNNLKKLFYSFSDILKSKNKVYFRAPAILSFSKLEIIISLNKKLGFFVLAIFLWLLKRKVIIWQFYPLLLKKLFKDQTFIYDCIDNINIKDHTKDVFLKEKRLFKISDLVTFNSKDLFKNKLKTNPILKNKSIIAVCGCNNILFKFKIKKIPKELINIPQKKVVFMGIFDYRVDVKLLSYIVSNNKNLRFIFIGQIRKNIKKKFYQIIKEKNVLYLGEKRKNELPSYLKNSDLGIIPYDTKSEFVRYSNPMKAYEYLASGLPVVSTNILALKDYPKDIVYTTDNKEEFSLAIKRLIDKRNEEKITIAKNIAKKNSWENKISLVEKFIIKNEKTY